MDFSNIDKYSIEEILSLYDEFYNNSKSVAWCVCQGRQNGSSWPCYFSSNLNEFTACCSSPICGVNTYESCVEACNSIGLPVHPFMNTSGGRELSNHNACWAGWVLRGGSQACPF